MCEAINGTMLFIIIGAVAYAVLVSRQPRTLRMLAAKLAALAEAQDTKQTTYKQCEAQYRRGLGLEEQ